MFVFLKSTYCAQRTSVIVNALSVRLSRRPSVNPLSSGLVGWWLVFLLIKRSWVQILVDLNEYNSEQNINKQALCTGHGRNHRM